MAPKTSQSFLGKKKCLGGLALPNFQYYYWATNLRAMHYWLQTTNPEHTAAWLKMEAAPCKPSSLPALLYSPGNSLQETNNILVRTTLPSFLHAPVEQNHSFPPSLMGKVFSAAGITSFTDFYIEGTFASFQQLAIKFPLKHSNSFQYSQIRSFAQAALPNFPFPLCAKHGLGVKRGFLRFTPI